MTSTTDSTGLEAFLAEAGWLRVLAGRLVETDPEDLVRDTWVQLANQPSKMPSGHATVAARSTH